MSLAPDGNGFVAAWYDTRDGRSEIYMRLLDGAGVPMAPERRLTTTNGSAYEPDVHVVGDDVAVAWYSKAPDGRLTPHIGSWRRDGTLQWTYDLAAEGRNPVLAARGDRIFAAWIADAPGAPAVWASWWNAAGEEISAPMQVAAAGTTTWNLNAAMDPHPGVPEARAWVAFDAKTETRAEEIFVATVGAASASVTRLTADDAHASKYPDIVVRDDRVALTWFDAKDGNAEVYLAMGGRDLLTTAGGMRGRRLTATSGQSIGAYLAWDHDRLGVAWCDDSEGQHEIFFEVFASDGAPLGEATRLTHTRATSWVPAIATARSGFMLAWNEYEPAAAGGHGAEGRSQIAVRALPWRGRGQPGGLPDSTTSSRR